MIIFYNRETGAIQGTIDGRMHTADHMKMWVGSEDENERLIVEWIPVAWFDKEGNKVEKDAVDEKGNSLAFAADFTPDHPQKDLFVEIDKNPSKIQEYTVDIETQELIPKDNG